MWCSAVLSMAVLLLISPSAYAQTGGARLEKAWTIDRDEKGEYLFLLPSDGSVDRQGNLLVLDKGRVHIYDAQGDFLSVVDVAEEGLRGEPSDLALDRNGNLFLCYPNMKLIQGFDRTGNKICSFTARKGTPMQVAVDSQHNVYLNEVTLEEEHILYKYDPEGNLITGFGEPREPDPMFVASDVSEDFREILSRDGFLGIDDQDNLYFTFRASYALRKYSSTGKLLWEVMSQEGLLPRAQPKEGVYHPVGDMDVIPDGYVFVLRVAPGGKGPRVDVWGSDGERRDTFRSPEQPYFALCVAQDRKAIYFIDSSVSRKVDKYVMKASPPAR